MIIVKQGINNTYVVIKLKDTEEIITTGLLSDEKLFHNKVKLNPELISTDHHYYFNPNSPKLLIEYSKYYNDMKYKPVDTTLLNSLDVVTWREFDSECYKDVYIEYSINELDEEVIPLVQALNKINDLSTTGSCCGHNKKPLWINIHFESLDSLSLLLKIISLDRFKSKFILISDSTLEQDNAIHLKLQVSTKGKIGYKYANELAEYLNLVQGV